MTDKNKFIIALLVLVILIVAVLVGYVLVTINVRIGMNETSYIDFVSRGIQRYYL